MIAPVKKVIENSSSRAMPGTLDSLYRSSSIASIEVLYNAACRNGFESGATKPTERGSSDDKIDDKQKQ